MSSAPATGFIDPPDPYAPLPEWRAYLEELHGLEQTAEVTTAAQAAEEQIAFLETDQKAAEEDDFSDLEVDEGDSRG